MADTNIQRVHTSAPTANTKCTISVWVKRSALNSSGAFGIYGGIDAAWNAAGNVQIGFNNDKAYCWFKTAGGDRKKQDSTRVFRDTNSWYHFVYRIDTTESSGDDRIRVYCNNELITDWGSYDNPGSSEDIAFTSNGFTNYIGKFNWTNGNANYFNGILSHFILCDGYSYAPTEFGETDATTGEWKIKTSPSVNYGNNGYFILKDGNSLTDQSGNGNNWSAHNGTLTKTEDCPSNVFATFNPLIPYNGTFTNGMTTYQAPSSNPVFGSLSTLGMSSGKYYAECKYSAGSNHYLILGIADNNFDACASTPDDLGKSGTTESIGYVVNTGAYRINNNNTSWGSAGGDGDILQIAVDKDNNRIYFGVNGTWGNSSNPANNTGGIDVSSVLTGDTWFFGVSNDTGSNETIAQFNFGNGYFGTSAISSEGTNASGIGKFEYDVPTGFTALSTKGLNE